MLEIHFFKNKIQNLITRTNMLKEYIKYDYYQEKLININKKLEKNSIWKDIHYAQSLIKQRSLIENKIIIFDQLLVEIKDLSNLLEILEDDLKDHEITNQITRDLNLLEQKIVELEWSNMFCKEHDYANCYLDIQAGSGGTEAQDWANMLIRMYLRWAENKGFKSEIISESVGDIAGIKSATLRILGNYAFGWLRTETGIHRLVRKSPFDSTGKRHTSFSSVFVYPELQNDIEIKINASDLRIDVYRASGAGGQHVNRTESAVRITHLPTGIITQCQNGRSQHRNKDQALRQMKAKLYELEKKKQNAKRQAIEENKSDIGWGRQIRSYILDNSRIKDLRTGVESRDIQAILNGELDIFIKASLNAGF
ncbi:MAG: peptide chain release factor 2 [Candidatus Dasytiphilus stammeri]